MLANVTIMQIVFACGVFVALASIVFPRISVPGGSMTLMELIFLGLCIISIRSATFIIVKGNAFPLAWFCIAIGYILVCTMFKGFPREELVQLKLVVIPAVCAYVATRYYLQWSSYRSLLLIVLLGSLLGNSIALHTAKELGIRERTEIDQRSTNLRQELPVSYTDIGARSGLCCIVAFLFVFVGRNAPAHIIGVLGMTLASYQLYVSGNRAAMLAALGGIVFWFSHSVWAPRLFAPVVMVCVLCASFASYAPSHYVTAPFQLMSTDYGDSRHLAFSDYANALVIRIDDWNAILYGGTDTLTHKVFLGMDWESAFWLAHRYMPRMRVGPKSEFPMKR